MRTALPEPGQSSEFTIFMRAYQDMVFSTAARLLGNRAHAEDIAQEVFVKAYEHFPQLRDSPTAGGWLKTVTTHLAINHLTRYRKRWRFFSEFGSSQSDDAAQVIEDFPSPGSLDADIANHQRHALLEAALQRLPAHQRVPLVLYHFDDLSYEAIAQRLRISLAKVKTDIRRGRAALLPVLKSAGMTRDSLES